MAFALMFDIQRVTFFLFLSNRPWQICWAWGSNAHWGALNTPAGLFFLLVWNSWDHSSYWDDHVHCSGPYRLACVAST